MHMKKLIVLLCVMCVFFVGCQKKEDIVDNSDVQKSGTTEKGTENLGEFEEITKEEFESIKYDMDFLKMWYNGWDMQKVVEINFVDSNVQEYDKEYDKKEDISFNGKDLVNVYLVSTNNGDIVYFVSKGKIVLPSSARGILSGYENCEKINGIELLDTSNVTDMGNMFADCKRLKSLDLSNFDTSNVTDMQTMFKGCESLTSIDISNFDTSNVTSMYSMFSGCGSLTSLDLNSFDTSNVTDMSYMFFECKNLKNLDLDKLDTSKVISMEGMFFGCENLKNEDISRFKK